VPDRGWGRWLHLGDGARGAQDEAALSLGFLLVYEVADAGDREQRELRLLAKEVGLVVREVGHHAPALRLPLGGEAQEAIVVLEGQEAEPGQASGQAAAQRGLLGVVEVEPELLVDEVAEQAELLLGQLHVVVGRAEHHSVPPTQAAPNAARASSGRGPRPDAPRAKDRRPSGP